MLKQLVKFLYQNTYWTVNGFENKIKDKQIEMAFLKVVTVTAVNAPKWKTKNKTAWTPQKPAIDNNIPLPYISQECWKEKKNNSNINFNYYQLGVLPNKKILRNP